MPGVLSLQIQEGVSESSQHTHQHSGPSGRATILPVMTSDDGTTARLRSSDGEQRLRNAQCADSSPAGASNFPIG